MFKNEYQGGPFVEIFSAQGKDPVAKWKLCGSQSICKDFDKEVKSFVYVLEGSSQTNRMQLPKDSKMARKCGNLCEQQLKPFWTDPEILDSSDFCTPGKRLLNRINDNRFGQYQVKIVLINHLQELSATPLHAKVPLSSIKRNIWCNICIDLVSFISEIFKGTAFLSLDGIIVSASCKLRKVFTMKLQPQDTADEYDPYNPPANGPIDLIPRSCQFTTDVPHVTQMINMDKLRVAEVKISGRPLSTESEQISNHGTASARSIRNQDACHIAFGSKVLGPPPATGGKISTSGTKEMASSLGSKITRTSYQARQSSGDRSESQTDRSEISSTRHTETQPQSVQENHQTSQPVTLVEHNFLKPHPPQKQPTERPSRRKQRVQSAGKEGSVLSDGTLSVQSGNKDSSSEKSVPPLHRRINSEGALHTSRPRKESGYKITEDWIFPDLSEDSYGSHSSEQALAPLQSVSSDLYPYLSGSEDEETEPQLNLKDVFTYSSRPHSASHGKSQNTSAEGFISLLDMGGDGDRDQRGARFKDDFLGSDSEEDDFRSRFIAQIPSPRTNPGTSVYTHSPGISKTTIQMRSCSSESRSSGESLKSIPSDIKVSDGGFPALKKADGEKVRTSVLPTPSLSPTGNRPGLLIDTLDSTNRLRSGQDNHLRPSFNRKSLKEISRDGTRLSMENSDYDWRNYQPTRMSASELRMLASLQRQQNEELEDDGNSPGLSASQIDNCNVSISTSSDDTTTWNSCQPPPVNQGHHYQKEMNPPAHSNPRDWLNVFSPPIIPPSQQMGECNIHQHKKGLSTGNEKNNIDDDDDEVLTLLYDPCLNCYFDPETGKYYELV
ncbi:protein CFAP20DC-like [Acipenser ruthenus]|uniref:protein CFAP20DC-like n=1 Tax=Acipenser ruthenus TaxID=7906 RepID=UPI0027410091|nr:protein CFAP20DC-like [Acipenser ruthenus]